MRFIDRHRALLAPITFVLLVLVIVVPLPPFIIDMLLCVNLAISIIILMTTMYINEPLDLSVFPSLLLGTTMLRLVLNIASTRLILTADAGSPEEAIGMVGKMVEAFGMFVAGGSVVVGAVVFLILLVVQFVVITKGATRISEVAARFTLDAMPGKQMAIDADLNAGVINENEARERRDRIAREADFFGAMDGASKFVRGDAVAGLIITVINFVGGIVVGVLFKGWPLDATLRSFTIVTIGDGLAAQVPAFIISLAAALIITRSGSKQSLGNEMTGQLSSRPVVLGLGSAFVTLLAFTPLPTIPLLALGAIMGGIAWATSRTTRRAKDNAARAAADESAKAGAAAPPVEDLLKVDVLELEVGYGLVALVDAGRGGTLLDRISAIRRQLAAEIGFVMPPVRIRDNMTLSPTTYRIKIRGNVAAEGETRPGFLLAMDPGIATGKLQGSPTKEPAFGLDAWWIDPRLEQRAQTMNYTVVDPTSVLATHLAEVVKSHAAELLTRDEVNNLVAQLKQHAPKLVEEAIPAIVKPGEVQKVLQNLLAERVPIRDLETIIETLADWASKTRDLDVLTEYVRNALRRTISAQFAARPSGGGGASAGRDSKPRIVCVTLDPAFEDFINGYIDRSAAGTTLTMPARAAAAVARRISDALKPVLAGGHQPVVIASPQVRAQVRQIIEPYVANAAVLGYNEIAGGVEVESLGLVTLPEEQLAGAA